MEEKLKNFLENRGIYVKDTVEVLNAVCDMFKCMADETRRDDPKAIETINRFEGVSTEIAMLISTF